MDTNLESTKQCVEPESTSALKITESDKREVITKEIKHLVQREWKH